MRPEQVSAELRRIASAVMASKAPRRELVAQDLSRVLVALRKEERQFTCEEHGPILMETEKTSGLVCPVCRKTAKLTDRTVTMGEATALLKGQKEERKEVKA